MNNLEVDYGSIISVDVNNYTVCVELDSGMIVKDIQIATSFFNTKEGSGIVGHPELYARAIVAKMPDLEYVVLGFSAALDQKRDETDGLVQDDTGYRSERPLMRPGDVSITGPVGNSVILESSGAVSMSGSPLSQVWLVPDPANLIKCVTDNLVLDVGYSRIKLENDRTRNKTNFEFTIRPESNNSTSSADDVSIKMGKDGNVFSISIGGAQVFHINPNKTVTINNNLMVRP